ncbi:SufE family protein [Aestuariivirga sp. YIM B02566]|uniref:SufE family protein n=1 Tax=Taklimakanibacter albus TaxID=2800327 RepID=A0ACC5RBM7_9HYPH|nr:SufE family protein [Aestuariivirga sp. YIM B02566]MBK1870018.1 SufE family protein [Aestuariivirga sp. YIM B02566]
MQETIESLKEDFAIIDEWEDRYRYVIELGRAMPPLAEAERIPANKVQGCASQVWIAAHQEKNGSEPRLSFTGDSDALIVKGLIAIIFRLFSGKAASEILAIDAGAILDELGLREHLTPQRSNGVASMVTRIKSDAQAALSSTH